MIKLKEHDLLMFLSGNADKEEMKHIQEWMGDSQERAQEIVDLKLIFDNVEELIHFKPVDDETEWQSFLQSTEQSEAKKSEVFDDVNLLACLDGQADFEQKSNLQHWRSTSTENERDFNILTVIHRESNQLKGFNLVDVDSEWASLAQMMKPVEKSIQVADNVIRLESVTRANTNTYVPISGDVAWDTDEERSARIFPMWYKYAAAASIAAVFFFAWILWPKNSFETIYADSTDKNFILKDGSEVVLHPNSSLTYPKKFGNERRVILEGNGTFAIEPDPQKPFTVEAKKTKMGVTVLGTKFRFEDHDEYVDVVENIEGSIRAYSIENPEIYVTMTAGDKYGFDGERFHDLNEKIEIIDNSKEYNILYVLDFLMQSSSWKVISAPYIKFDEKGMVRIDLEKPIEEILEDLKMRADFEYSVLGNCEKCFRIERFAPR